jgi:hypothetical protein
VHRGRQAAGALEAQRGQADVIAEAEGCPHASMEGHMTLADCHTLDAQALARTGLTHTDLAAHVALGITAAMLARAQVRRVDDFGARERLTTKHSGNLSGILYPYLSPINGHATTYRLRRDHPEMEGGKPKDKYLLAWGNHRHLYFPPGCASLLADATVDVIIAEAEKSVLSITCAAECVGRSVLAVGTGGCWGWRGKVGIAEDETGARVDERGPLPDFSLISWTGRTVVIAFDANSAANENVQVARRMLAKELTGRGAVIRVVDLPAEPGINGPDDYIGAHGAEAFFALVDDAERGSADSLEAAIERLNKRFAIISVGNKVVVMQNLPDGSIKKLWPFEEFKKFLSKEHVTVGGADKSKQVPLAGLWLTHPAGRRYESLIYDMPGSAERCGPEDYNGYLGFTMTPKPGDWSKNKDHLLTIICGGIAALYDWLFNWCAALVQWPGRHAFTALVLRGKQGVGKGHFAHLMLGALFHKQQYLHIIGAGALTGQFNEHLSGKVLVFADESTWGGDPKAANKLKGLVTESTVPIERKFLPLVEEPSALHIVIASNDEWPVAIPKDDRRYVVFDVADGKRQNDAHFTPLREELANGGLAAMLNDLLVHEIDESALRHPPTTKGKEDVMLQSLKPIERWWFEKLLEGAMSYTIADNNTVMHHEDWPSTIQKTQLHEDYLAFLDKYREHRARRSTETELGMFLSKYAGARSLRGVWELKPLEDCRGLWVGACGWGEKYRWPEDPSDTQIADRDDEVPF